MNFDIDTNSLSDEKFHPQNNCTFSLSVNRVPNDSILLVLNGKLEYNRSKFKKKFSSHIQRRACGVIPL